MRARLPVLLLAIASLAGCCASAEMKQNATATIDALDSAVSDHEKAVTDAIAALGQNYVDAVRQRCEADWRAKIHEQRARVLTEVAAKKGYWRKRITADLEEALGPTLDQLKSQLDTEKTRNQSDATLSRDREYRLAAQLASTLAIANQQADKLSEAAESELDAVQVTLLQGLDPSQPLPEGSLPTVDVRALLGSSDLADTKKYAEAVHAGMNELRRFVTMDSALTLSLKGLLGDSLGAKLGGLLTDKASKIVDTYSTSLASKVTAWASDVSTKLTAKDKDLEAARTKK
jgi:hypothetical protein